MTERVERLPLPGKTDAAAWARSWPAGLWVALIVVASASLRFVVAARTGAPWIFPDELIYSELARSFAATHTFSVRGDPFSILSYGPLYPIAISPAYRLSASLTHAYLIVKAINCVAVSSAAVPAYLLARRLVSRRSAVFLALLAAALPSSIYSTKVMTESFAYPIFIWAVLAMTSALVRPSRSAQLLALAAIGLAISSRAQMIVLLPAFLLSIALVCAFERGRTFRRELQAFATTWTCVGGGAVLAAMTFVAAGSWRSVLGQHTVLTDRIRPLGAPLWALYHLAELDLYSGVAPLVAFALVVGMAAGTAGSRRLRAYAACTFSCGLGLLALVAVYATQPTAPPKIYDRYLFYLLPLLLLALLIWLEHGAPRPRYFFPTVAVGIVLTFAIPYSTVLNDRVWGVSSSTVGLIPWGMLRRATHSLLPVYATLAVGSAYVAWAFLRSTGSRRLVRLVAANIVVLNLFAQFGNAGVTHHAVAAGLGPGNRAWVDAATGKRATAVAIWPGLRTTGPDGWYGIWETEFFNSSVGAVYDLEEPMRYRLPSMRLTVRDEGQLYLPNGTPLVADYVLTSGRIRLDGRQVAAGGGGMVLYRVAGRVRLR
jgi:Dolichyl-phosphate-mannose-protein mannosyltransferase